jgi:hypothetical protein
MDHAHVIDPFGWLNDRRSRAVAIAGICKNAGKTTLLNHFLVSSKMHPRGVFTTGIDGEDEDTVYRIAKPKVGLNAGDIFCCDTKTLDLHGSSLSVLDELPQSDRSRKLWLAKTETPLQTEITGPSTVSAQVFLLQLMLQLGAQQVFIDGSLDRKSITLSADIDAVAMLIGANYGSLQNIIGELKRLLILNQMTVYITLEKDSRMRSDLLSAESVCVLQKGKWTPTQLKSLIGTENLAKEFEEREPEALYIPGALTDAAFLAFAKWFHPLNIPLIFRHPECLKLSLTKLERCMQQFCPSVLIPYQIRSFVLNSLSLESNQYNADEFRTKLRREFPLLDLPDIKEIVHA